MRVFVTCGPSYEPIDEVRRLTNFSTGELGAMLTERLVEAGAAVTCFRGVTATFPLRVKDAHVVPFATNDHLQTALAAVKDRQTVTAIFHTAALCDYRLKRVQASDGKELAAAKFPSRGGELTLTLEPAAKVLSGLRELFPVTRIVGWKFELNGSRAEALRAVELQMIESSTDAGVINGAAYGSGFGFMQPGAEVVHCSSRAALCECLLSWLGGHVPRRLGAD